MTVEHLKPFDLLEAVPMSAPRKELMAAVSVVVIAARIGTSPNPRLLPGACFQAQNHHCLARARRAPTTRQQGGAHHRRRNEPALNALQDLEEQVRQMSAGDDQLSAALAALAAIAGGLASDPVTQQLANAISTDNRREISQAAKDLAAALSNLSGQDQPRCGCPRCCATRRVGRAAYRRAWLAISQRRCEK